MRNLHFILKFSKTPQDKVDEIEKKVNEAIKKILYEVQNDQ